MIANVLIGIAEQNTNLPPEAAARYQKTIENVKKTYEEKLMHNGRSDLAIGRVDFVSTRAEVDTYLSKGLYDVFLCTDRLSGDKEGIGIGTIRQWKEKYPNVHTYLLLEPKRDKESKKLFNTGKLANLYLEGYYVALFVNEILSNEEEFFHVLMEGRTKEEAYRYYELNDEIVGRILETKIRKKPEPVDVPSIKDVDVILEEDQENTADYNAVEEAEETESLDREMKEVHQTDLFEEIPEENLQEEDFEKEEDDMHKPYEEEYREDTQDYRGSYSPRMYLNLDSLGATASYSFDGVIGEIISDDVLIIRCPGGGLFPNKESLKSRKIEIVLKDL